MTVEPDAASFAPRRAPTPRPAVLSALFWLAICFAAALALIALLVVMVFLVGPRLVAGQSASRATSAASSDARPSPPGARPVQAVSPLADSAIVAALPQPAGLAALQSRVANLETRQGRILDAAAEALAVDALSRAADQPQPFGQVLSAYARVLPGAATSSLTPLAQQGAPTRAELARSLDDLAARLAVEARLPAYGASLPTRIVYALSRLVSIRQVDPKASGPDALIARAQTAANAGDIEGALSLLSRLPASTGALLGTWRDLAHRRIAIDQALAGLQAQALTDLALARSAPP